MRNLTRTCLIISACCVITLRAIAIRNEKPTTLVPPADAEDADDIDFDYGHFIDVGDDDDDDEDRDRDVGKKTANLEKPRRPTEPEAEMLPENYQGVKPPGVDHMEMTRPKRTRMQAADIVNEYDEDAEP